MAHPTVFRLKPNPLGKDKNRLGQPTPSQLAGEWLDIRNSTAATIALTGLKIWHRAYKPDGSSTWEVVTTLSGDLDAGKVLRIHSGKQTMLAGNDLTGADKHVFIGRDQYVWNNAEGDTADISQGTTALDQASYAPNPPEGVILRRAGNSLVP